MTISPKSIKVLWSASGGRCAFPGCWERLSYHESEGATPHTLGEMAHIRGDKPGSNRHDPKQTDAERDDYQNLILLCPTHHTQIDRKENESVYTVEVLNEMKSAHEARVLKILNENSNKTIKNISREILILLEENRQSWAQYGPLSELARTQPENEAAHAVWLSERLSIIVPNNRKIEDILIKNRNLFAPHQQGVITAFLMHTRSYEQWVEDTIPYAAVTRFPVEFETLIKENANASI